MPLGSTQGNDEDAPSSLGPLLVEKCQRILYLDNLEPFGSKDPRQ